MHLTRWTTRLATACAAVAVVAVAGAAPAVAAGPVVSSSPIVGLTPSPTSGGYWQVAADGGVFAFGDAHFYGSMGGQHLAAPVVDLARTPSGYGYWLTASDGGIFAFGDAHFYGSMGGQHLNAPVVGIAATPDGAGYWLVASDGGIFAYGNARFLGSTGGRHLNAPVTGMAATHSGNGYLLTAADGGVFAYGDARFAGSAASIRLAMPVVAVASTKGAGYWLTARDGGVFSYGDAAFTGHAVYTGSASSSTGSTAVQLAQRLLGSGSAFQTVHPSAVRDNATARQNLVDTAAGRPASRSCYGTAPCGTVTLKVTMLQALLEITQGHTIRVSEIAGASHTAGSLHYQGTAFDIDKINGAGGSGDTITHAVADPLVAVCNAQGAKQAWLETAAGKVAASGAKGNHVHCGWSPTVA